MTAKHGKVKAPRPGRYSLVAFDVDGTLIGNAQGKVVWELLNAHFGEDPAINRQRVRAYFAGELSYPEWVALDIQGWVDARATREAISRVITEQLYLMPGARETVEALREAGYRLAVISGTLNLTLELLFPEHPFEQVYTNRIHFDADGAISGWEATPYDMDGKGRALQHVAAAATVPLEQTVFVGDHINDLSALRIAGLGVAYAPKDPSVSEAAHEVIHDLRELLSLLED